MNLDEERRFRRNGESSRLDRGDEISDRDSLREIPAKPRSRVRSLLKWGAVIGAFVAYSSLYTIDQTEQAVITQFGKPVKVILNPLEGSNVSEIKKRYQKEGMDYEEGSGLKTKIPFIQAVNKFDRRLLRWDGYPEEIPTRDKKYVWIDATARWLIEDPLLYFRRIGIEEQAHARLDEIVDASLRNSITNRDLIEVVRTDNREMQTTEEELKESLNVGNVNEGRSKIIAEITANSKKMCEEYGIAIHRDGVLIKGMTYVESVKNSVEDRMISERTRIAERYKSEGQGEYERIMGEKVRDIDSIKSEAYKIARGLEGEADATAVQIYAQGYSQDPEFYQFTRKLDLYRQTLKGARLVVGTDNPLLKLLKGDVKK